MDWKTRTRILSIGICLSACSSQLARAGVFVSQTDVSATPLNDSKVTELRPTERNPWRQTWELARRVFPLGLEAKTTAALGMYQGSVQGIRLATEVFVRPVEFVRFHQPLAEACMDARGNTAFHSYEQSLATAEEAARRWEQLLKTELTQLEARIRRETDRDRGVLVARLLQIFSSWTREQDYAYQNALLPSIRRLEKERLVASLGKQVLRCKGAASLRPPTEADANAITLRTDEAPTTRIPIRWSDGGWVARVSLDYRGKARLNGRFLIDLDTLESEVSPDFLDFQGVPIARGEWAKRTAVDPLRLFFEKVTTGTHELRLQDLKVTPTERFLPPHASKICCDGVLGWDFFAQYLVEYRPGPFPELLLWKRGVKPTGGSALWLELPVEYRDDGLVSTVCEPRPIRWVSAMAARNVLGAKKSSEATHGKFSETLWSCEDTKLFRVISAAAAGAGQPWTPSVEILRELRWAVDVSGGKLWVSRAELPLEELPNLSGLELRFVLDQLGDRELRVVALSGGAWIKPLVRQGLTLQSRILEINGVDVSKINAQEVQRHLSGIVSSKLQLKWKTGAQVGEAVLELPKNRFKLPSRPGANRNAKKPFRLVKRKQPALSSRF